MLGIGRDCTPRADYSSMAMASMFPHSLHRWYRLCHSAVSVILSAPLYKTFGATLSGAMRWEYLIPSDRVPFATTVSMGFSPTKSPLDCVTRDPRFNAGLGLGGGQHEQGEILEHEVQIRKICRNVGSSRRYKSH